MERTVTGNVSFHRLQLLWIEQHQYCSRQCVHLCATCNATFSPPPGMTKFAEVFPGKPKTTRVGAAYLETAPVRLRYNQQIR
jgi:hypothetical protein